MKDSPEQNRWLSSIWPNEVKKFCRESQKNQFNFSTFSVQSAFVMYVDTFTLKSSLQSSSSSGEKKVKLFQIKTNLTFTHTHMPCAIEQGFYTYFKLRNLHVTLCSISFQFTMMFLLGVIYKCCLKHFDIHHHFSQQRLIIFDPLTCKTRT